MMSPLVSLAAASSVTSKLILGTAVVLLLEHDLVDLATQVATLDVLSAGRAGRAGRRAWAGTPRSWPTIDPTWHFARAMGR